MRRLALAFLLLAPFGAGAWAEEEAVAVLADAAPLRVALKQGRSTWTGRVDVPARARALSLVVAADGDVDVFLKHGKPVSDDRSGE
jgi:hypothetical protein